MRALAVALLVATAAAAAAPPVRAQEAPELAPLLQRIATLWAAGDAGAIARHVAQAGVELEVGGRSVGPIAPRQVAAALRRVFAGRETVSVVATRAEPVGGAEGRAYGELAWGHRPGAHARTEQTTVFVGLVREGRGWRVSQIRILP